MPLINCPDCKHEVSDAAPSCPNCGRPIASANDVRDAGSALTTTQMTSKRFKLQGLLALAIMIIAIVWYVTAEDPIQNVGAMLVFLIGLVWSIINRIRIWWHHN